MSKCKCSKGCSFKTNEDLCGHCQDFKCQPMNNPEIVEDWEKRFDEQFGFMFRIRKAGSASLIKFIREELALRDKQLKERILSLKDDCEDCQVNSTLDKVLKIMER